MPGGGKRYGAPWARAARRASECTRKQRAVGNITTEINSSLRVEHETTMVRGTEALVINQESFDQRFKNEFIFPASMQQE